MRLKYVLAPPLRKAPFVHTAARTVYHQLMGFAGSNVPVMMGPAPPFIVDRSLFDYDWQHEREAKDWIRSHLSPGETFFDLGAFVGEYTLIGARSVGPRGRVLSVEPAAPARALLERNLALNNFGQWTQVRGHLLGNRIDEQVPFYVPRESDRPDPRSSLSAQSGTPTLLRMMTLDALIDESGLVPQLIKMDVEGAEAIVLEGAAETMTKFRPKIVCAVHPDILGGSGLSAFLTTVKAANYGIYDLRGSPIARPGFQEVLLLPH